MSEPTKVRCQRCLEREAVLGHHPALKRPWYKCSRCGYSWMPVSAPD